MRRTKLRCLINEITKLYTQSLFFGVLIVLLLNHNANAQKKLNTDAFIQTKAEISTITDTISSLISKNYVYKDKGQIISKAFIGWSENKFNDYPISFIDYAKEASLFLKEISNDKHFFIQAAKNKKSAGALEVSSEWSLGSDKGYGFTKYELLNGNIAYVKYTFFNFTMMPEAIKTIDRMMAQLYLSDAIIIDLRGNPGGDSEMADYMFSYFMPEDSLYLSSFMQRNRDGEMEYSESFSTKDLAENRINNKAVYILVNGKTGSSAEYFTFLAQKHINAVIVGNRTVGAGHSLSVLKINSHLTIGVPSGRLYDKISDKGWEETNGITPDIIVDDSITLKKAYNLALDKMKTK